MRNFLFLFKVTTEDEDRAWRPEVNLCELEPEVLGVCSKDSCVFISFGENSCHSYILL